MGEATAGRDRGARARGRVARSRAHAAGLPRDRHRLAPRRPPRAARRARSRDGATRAEAAAAADVVVLAAPPATNLRLLRRLAKVARPGLVITDVSSVKGEIVREAARLGLRGFVGRAPDGGHREARLRRVVAGPLPRGRVVDRARARPARDAASCGPSCGRRARGRSPCDAATHDRAMAFLSHVPQVVAWALLEAARGDAVARRHLRRAGHRLPRHDAARPQPAPAVARHPRREPRRGAPRPRGAGARASRGGRNEPIRRPRPRSRPP